MAKTGKEYQTEIRKIIGDIFGMKRLDTKGIINPPQEAYQELCDELHKISVEYSINHKQLSKDGLNILKNMTYSTGEDVCKYAVDIEIMIFHHIKPTKSIYDTLKKEHGFIKPGKYNGKMWEYPND